MRTLSQLVDSITEDQFKEMQWYRDRMYSYKQIATMYDLPIEVVRAKFEEFKKGLIQMKLLNVWRTKNMSIKLSDFLDINDINFEENSIFRELVKVSVM